jgi:hypothetical protein
MLRRHRQALRLSDLSPPGRSGVDGSKIGPYQIIRSVSFCSHPTKLFRYNAHQSEITMSMFAGDYEVNYGGSRVKLKEHIGYGVSTEPRHTIRVAFFFDESARKVVIGYIGQHQATRKSN